MDAFLQIEVMGTGLWRILGLFAIILIAMLLGRVARFLFERLGERVDGQERPVAAMPKVAEPMTRAKPRTSHVTG